MIKTTFVNGISPFGPRDEARSHMRRPDSELTVSEQKEKKRIAVLNFIRWNPGCVATQIMDQTKMCKFTVQRYLGLLIADGLVAKSPTSYNAVGRQIGCRYWGCAMNYADSTDGVLQ